MSISARVWTIVGLVAAVTALAGSVAWTVNAATWGHPVHGWPGIHQTATGQYEAASGLEGSLVDVIAMDMGGHGMMNRSGAWTGGTMLLRTHRVEVPASTVSLRLYNAGAFPHEIACNIENHYAAGMYTLLVVR